MSQVSFPLNAVFDKTVNIFNLSAEQVESVDFESGNVVEISYKSNVTASLSYSIDDEPWFELDDDPGMLFPTSSLLIRANNGNCTAEVITYDLSSYATALGELIIDTSTVDGVVDAKVAYGIVSHPSLDQTSAIIEMRDDLASLNFGGKIVWPDGTICYTGPIDWSGVGKTRTASYLSSPSQVRPPSFESATPDGTNFRMLNAETENVTGFIFSLTDAQAAAGIIHLVNAGFKNVTFTGPGLSVQKTTLNGNAVAGTSFSIAGALAVVGDAICLIQGAKRHWATVIGVSGAGPQTITLDARQSLLSTYNTGGTVLLFKQSRLLQLGGTRTAASSIISYPTFENVQFCSALQGLCMDDCTGPVVTMPLFGDVVHCICFGYNLDQLTTHNGQVGDDRAPITATCTNGSAVITNSTLAKVGSKVWEVPNADGTLNFPEHTHVLGVSGSGPYTVTLSEPYVGTTGAKTLLNGQGVFIVAGRGSSAFLPNFASNGLNNYSSIVVNNILLGRTDRFADMGDTIGKCFTANGGYMEASQRIMSTGIGGGEGGPGPFLFNNFFVQDPESMTGPAFEDFLGVSFFDLRVAGIGNPKFPLFQSAGASCHVYLRAGWSWTNDSTAAKNYLNTSPAIVALNSSDTNASLSIPQGTDWAYNCGPIYQADSRGSVITNTAVAGALNWNWPGVSGMDLTLTGDLTAGSIVYGVPVKGYELTMMLKQDGTGGRTVTLGSNFLTGAGSELGTAGIIAGGTANQSLYLKFMSNGTSLILQGNQVLTWLA